jgi:hypothetical protein
MAENIFRSRFRTLANVFGIDLMAGVSIWPERLSSRLGVLWAVRLLLSLLALFALSCNSAAIGRIASEDSIGAWGDEGNLGNAFTFEGNNPGSERDPFGLDASWWNKSVWSVEAALPCGLFPDSGVDLFLNERSQYIAKKQQLYDQAARASWQKAEFTNTASAVMWQSLNNVEEFGEKAEALAPTPLAYLGMGLQAVGVDEAVINSWYLESQATPWVYDDSVAVAMGGIVRGTQLADEFVSQRLGVRMFAPNSAVTPLYRAVSPAELADLKAAGGGFRNPAGIEVKYFSETAEGAASYAQQAHRAGGAVYEGPYTIVRTEVPSNAITPIMRAAPDRGIPTVTLPTEAVPRLAPGQPLPYSPIPGAR